MEKRSARLKRKEARIWIPPLLVKTILFLGHDDPMSAHLDVQRTFHRISSTFWWPNMWNDVEEWVRTSKSCQLRKSPKQQNMGSIQPGFTAAYPFQYVAMDITELPTVNTGMKHIMVFIDFFTR